MQLNSAVRIIHSFHCANVADIDINITVHMNRTNEEYTGKAAGFFSKHKALGPREVGRYDQGDAAIASKIPDKDAAMRREQNACKALSWDARDFVLGLTLREDGKDCTIYLPVDEIIAITGSAAT